MKRNALGRGLASLIPEGEGALSQSIRLVDINSIVPNPYQPRMKMGKEELQSLSESLQRNGMIQPVLVTRGEKGFTLVAGERRYQAAKSLGWKTVPAIIKDLSTPLELLEVALIENLQREDLDPIEEARAYVTLKEEFNLTQEEIAKRVGRSRAAVANSLRLLDLPDEIQSLLRDGALTAGHARTLLREGSEEAQIKLAHAMMGEGWTVRESERRIRERKPRKKPRDLFVVDAEERLMQVYKTRIEIRRRGKRGMIRLHFHSEDELIRIVDTLMGGRYGKKR
ncbi:MAG TPA: ParB/RepB/Spo0J family partition protein [Thermoanaerobaculia bacterium]|nr:ParB/RepB/Spo0J family partition protein [Thermoanaerobaculia bacterium]HUM29171.1 ParB/RepB/Spo0J family partition protein [Thermoanaerobaculia bacterium]HXK67549.1 ParB/RepB/Spo0J family partition protein [Thermoanaerobaculia bacterium]